MDRLVVRALQDRLDRPVTSVRLVRPAQLVTSGLLARPALHLLLLVQPARQVTLARLARRAPLVRLGLLVQQVTWARSARPARPATLV